MKNLLASLLLLSSFSVVAADSLVVTLTARQYSEVNGWKVIKLPSLNAKLKKAGLAEFPATVTLTKKDGDVWMKYVDLLETANEKLKAKYEILPDDNLIYGSAICYNGATAGVLKTIEGLRGSMIHEDMGIYGYRMGKKVKITFPGNDFLDVPEMREMLTNDNPYEVRTWDNYDTSSDDVLLATNYGQQGDGTEMNVTVIKRCK